MNKKTRAKWQIVTAIAVCCLLFVFQGSLYRFLEIQKARFVSPIFLDITMIRLQRVHKLQGDAIIMGSSITERLMTSSQTATLGVPSSSFTAALKLLEGAVQFPAGTTYVLETNNLFNRDYEPVLKDAAKWDFRHLRDSKHFSIAAKPTNLLLSTIYHLQNGKNQNEGQIQHDTPVVMPDNLDNVTPPTQEELAEWAGVIEGIKKIRLMGGRICLAQFPTQDRQEFAADYAKAHKLAKHLDLPVLNYNVEEWHKRLIFTDSRHLNSRIPSTGELREAMARDAKACAK